jgi:hypothetical protein
MSAPIEYRGLPALEYAAQTGAQLCRQRRPDEIPQPIDAAVAYALWKLGASHQVVCIGVDHRALAKAQPYAGFRPSIKRSGRKLARVSTRGLRRLSALVEQAMLFVRYARVFRLRARHAETQPEVLRA